ncbi:hypothetical protein M3M35_06550 [Fructilactobacillus myrtifloralis]|uniref:Iron-sulfur cluster biosynthesis family protein n=1 Tax=Fructilactobacillus myrtifloralis TaxID=2940301 RepID=A0ABY5BMP2_9LACO|nr:hypothetical protein [Fructilactobacillus myrtifloralis]USS84945.1 hypothetical protein M3M35_06550 [Fructilactobacillus myrtifloralis]
MKRSDIIMKEIFFESSNGNDGVVTIDGNDFEFSMVSIPKGIGESEDQKQITFPVELQNYLGLDDNSLLFTDENDFTFTGKTSDGEDYVANINLN